MDYRKFARSAFYAILVVGFVVSFAVCFLGLAMFLAWGLHYHTAITVASVLTFAIGALTAFNYERE